MAKACINIQPVKNSSEIHNKRLKDYDYVRKDLTPKNESWELCSIPERRNQIKDLYLKTVGQQMQKKATPIREAVVLIEGEGAMPKLKKLAKDIEEKFGIKTFQIHTHLDEGHWGRDDDGKPTDEWKPNYHAHMVFDWTDSKTGKSIKMNPTQMAQLQTLTANTMEMERGESSNVKRLSAVQYKAMKMEENINALTKTNQKLENKNRDLELMMDKLKEERGIREEEIKYMEQELNKKDRELEGLESLRNEKKKLENAIQTLTPDTKDLFVYKTIKHTWKADEQVLDLELTEKKIQQRVVKSDLEKKAIKEMATWYKDFQADPRATAERWIQSRANGLQNTERDIDDMRRKKRISRGGIT